MYCRTLALKEFKLKSATGGTDALGLATIVVEDSTHHTFIGEAASTDVIMASVYALNQMLNEPLDKRQLLEFAIAGEKIYLRTYSHLISIGGTKR